MPYVSLSSAYLRIGQSEKSAAAAREAIRINPNVASTHINLAVALLRLNRYDESREVVERAIEELKLDNERLRTVSYHHAFIRGDAAVMRQQIDTLSGKPTEYLALDWQTDAAAFAGQWRSAQEFSRRAIDLATRSDAKEVAAQYAAQASVSAAVFGQCAQARAAAAQSLALEHNQISLPQAALALALCGETTQAQSPIDELSRQYPKDTLINSIWLPAIRAAIELQRGNAEVVIESLQPTSRYETAAEFWPQYLRGQAYLRLNKATEAIANFQNILDHRGQASLSVLYPLAALGLARASAMTGDASKARQSYQEFLALWKEADADLPMLIEAKKEFERLK